MSKIIIRPGLIDRLQKLSGIQDDSAFARTIGTSRSTLDRVRNGDQPPSADFIAGIASAFGFGIGEVATLAPASSDKTAA